MGIAAYRAVLGTDRVRAVLLLGFVIRVPLWASMIVLTLHVVGGLDRSYSEAGLVTTLSTIALAVAGPWRGRMLDRIGLRATVAPQLVVLLAVWSVAPFVEYAVLLPLVVVSGLATVPTFSIVRQSLIASVDDEHRTAALSLDALATEISFMIGPVLGVLVATWIGTEWSLLGFQMVGVLGGVLLFVVNPPLVAPAAAGLVPAIGRVRGWWSPTVVAVLICGAAATIVLTATDLGVVAALRAMEHPSSIGWVLAVWGLGSAIGALVYGAMHRTVSVFVLLGLLAATTVPVALATDRLQLAALLFVCGIFCAPTITATADTLSRIVPASVLGEVMGWHGVAFTVGSAVGAPLAGIAIDHRGWQGAFVLASLVALAMAAIGWLAARLEPEPRCPNTGR
ncbi:MFS transporter [Nocardioides cavernaquae]|uniref:MFS transporter n=1 Tax=Nocardioides cavernaquae TaxID=2321396 RepID=A0A3A5H6Y7_9ACTN|nr:MFS transporter [Nocardioides cavernaquae]RJS45648.1 MFS transporter [Nocardioides cavernaquae]